jgi:transcriptional regulator PpsR
MAHEPQKFLLAPALHMAGQSLAMKHLLTPATDLSGLSPWAPELAQTFVSLTSDIALVLDDDGTIRSVAQGQQGPQDGHVAATHDWVGRRWADTVTGETRAKVDQLLAEVNATGLARRREINHPGQQGGNVAVAYTAIRLGQDGPLLAVGRDLGAIAAIQQRFIEAQQEMERGYWRARQAEARYRLLFQVATDAVLLVDAHNWQVLEANQAAAQLFDMPVEQLVGRAAAFGFERTSRLAVEDLMATARDSGQAGEIRARLTGRTAATSVAATPFSSDNAPRLLVRIRTLELPGAAADLNATLARLVDSASDGVVVTDSAGRILVANPAFVRQVRLQSENEVKGHPLTDWVGVSDLQFSQLLQQVRHIGVARGIASRLLSSDAQISQVDVSAALLTEGDQECIGFTIRYLQPAPMDADEALRKTVEQLSAQVGQTPLPELLRHAALLLERHFVRVALERNHDDSDAAAQMLGIPRQRLDGHGNGDPSSPASA